MDYSKCDFAPIIGAYIEMKTRYGKGDCWTVKGKVLFQDNGLVWVERDEGKHWNDCIIIRDIASGSLKATMKPRDMSPEQLHRLADEIASEHYGERYHGIESIAFGFDKNGKLSDEISVDLHDMPLEDGFVLDPNTPVDVTHWLKENKQ